MNLGDRDVELRELLADLLGLGMYFLLDFAHVLEHKSLFIRELFVDFLFPQEDLVLKKFDPFFLHNIARNGVEF